VLGHEDDEERERRVLIFAQLREADPSRSVFAWPTSPPRREWIAGDRLTLWRPFLEAPTGGQLHAGARRGLRRTE
jgi:hypothetical protein